MKRRSNVAVSPDGSFTATQVGLHNDLLEAVLRLVRVQTHNDHVMADTPLMDAGINSLSATMLAQRLGQRPGVGDTVTWLPHGVTAAPFAPCPPLFPAVPASKPKLRALSFRR